MDFVPAPSISQMEVILREDYRYGFADPLLWPQRFMPGFEYLAGIPHPDPTMPLRYVPLWSSLTESDFILIEGSIIKCLGLLRPDYLAPLFCLVDELSEDIVTDPMGDDPCLSWLKVVLLHARDRLIHFPCTWRNVHIQLHEVQ